MHGIKKSDLRGLSEEKQLARAKKTEQYKMLAKEVLRRRAARVYDEKSLALTNKFLEINPECYTVWNFRREMLSGIFASQSEEERRATCEKELHFLEGALMKNPKAYTTWEHRLWTVRKHGAVAAKELALCDKFLKFDERNFHCWGYRRHMAALAGASAADELAFTDTKVDNNFSNYSAWHSRTKLLPQVHQEREALHAALAEEFEKVQAAFFTEPDDQSCWFYHQWLVAAGRPQHHSKALPTLTRLAGFACSDSALPVVVIAFDPPVSGVHSALSVRICAGETELSGEWVGVSADAKGHAAVWSFVSPTPPPAGERCCLAPASADAALCDQHGDQVPVAVLLADSSAVPRVSTESSDAAVEEVTAACDVVSEQLSVLSELLEVEESCKWALYTESRLLLELAALQEESAELQGQPLPTADDAPADEESDHAREARLSKLGDGDGGGAELAQALGPLRGKALRNLSRLSTIDPAHQAQFDDLRSAQALEGAAALAASQWAAATDLQRASQPCGLSFSVAGSAEGSADGLLRAVGISRLSGLESLLCLRRLDLSGNRLSSLIGGGGDFSRLPFLVELLLERNELRTLHGMCWPAGLLRFSAAHNHIAQIGRIRGGGTATLKSIDLSSNPVCGGGAGEAAVRTAFGAAGLVLPALEELLVK